MNSLLSGRRVLVVEDEVMIARMLESMLTSLGCTVVDTAARIDQALAMIETLAALDVVVLDLSLNGKRSYPIADALVARGIPFVFSTGFNKDNMPEAYQNVPMLQKPYRETELGDALVKLLTPEEPVHLGSGLIA